MKIKKEEYLRFEEEFNEYIKETLKKIETNESLRNEDIEECMKVSRTEDEEIALRILVNTFNRISGNMEFTKLKYKVMMEGFILGFSINKITNKQFEQYQDSNKIRIFGCKKVEIEKYWLEIQFRRRVMEDIINMQYDEGLQSEHRNKEYDE